MKTKEKIGNGTLLVTDGSLKYVEFESLNQFEDILTHCMSTRVGGCSTGEYGTLNLGFNKNDGRENVLRNFRLICGSAGFSENSLVLSNQVHESVVRRVDQGDMGKGFCRESDIIGVDGLLTQAEGVTLVTFYADCIPVFLFEPGIKAIALIHSGWKGTLKGIAAAGIKKMAELPGFQANRLMAVLGPSIGRCCFEVGEDVYRLFAGKYEKEDYFEPLQDRKWRLNLQGMIKDELMEEGIKEENIQISGICTKCRKDLFFSHRGDNGKTGSLAAFMQLKRNAVRSGT